MKRIRVSPGADKPYPHSKRPRAQDFLESMRDPAEATRYAGPSSWVQLRQQLQCSLLVRTQDEQATIVQQDSVTSFEKLETSIHTYGKRMVLTL